MALRLFNNIRSSLLSDPIDFLFDSLESKQHTIHSLQMPVDIQESPDSFILIADIPGLTKQDVKLSVDDKEKMIIIEAERKREKKVDGVNYYRSERPMGHVYRSFGLPETADTENVAASFEHGVLTVTIGKKTPDHQRKKLKTVEIQ